MSKTCIKCKEIKSVSFFYKKKTGELIARCKTCHKVSVENHYEKNKHSILEKKKEYFQVNKGKITQRMSKYRTERSKLDVNFRIANNLRSRLAHAIRKNYKTGSAVSDLGCSIEVLKLHLESCFKEGMTWGNYGTWHIDHIIPISSFNLANQDELRIACHYSNLQPLWAEDNIRKGSSL